MNTKVNDVLSRRGHAVEQLGEAPGCKLQNRGSLDFFIDLTFLEPSNTAFIKLWSADHKWSSGSALVVLLD
jgi:hypothetical protein